MIRRIFLVMSIVLVVLPVWGQEDGSGSNSSETKLPVFYLKYDAALGSEETEEEDVEESSYRHTVSLRIKEEFSPRLTANLLTAFSRKEYLLQAGSYRYFYLNPYFTVDLTDAVRWYNGFRTKWILFDELDSSGLVKDYTSIYYSTRFVFSPITPLKITPSFKGMYDIYDNPAKSRQSYTFGLDLDARIDSVTLGGGYKAITRFPLDEESEVPFRLDNEIGVNLSWDPNKL